MASFNKFQQFVGDLGLGVHNLNTGTLKIALTNTAPVATNATLSQITQISGGNGYTTGGTTVPTTAYSQTTGTGTLTGGDVVFTATGAVGPFRYAVLYNDTPTSPADPLIGFWDYGSSISLANGETFTVDIGASILTVA
jgi:hypothetical protein